MPDARRGGGRKSFIWFKQPGRGSSTVSAWFYAPIPCSRCDRQGPAKRYRRPPDVGINFVMPRSAERRQERNPTVNPKQCIFSQITKTHTRGMERKRLSCRPPAEADFKPTTQLSIAGVAGQLQPVVRPHSSKNVASRNSTGITRTSSPSTSMPYIAARYAT